MDFATTSISRSSGFYHKYVPPVSSGDDPLEQLLLGKTGCGSGVWAVVSHLQRPSPISAHESVQEAVLAGMYCGNCWPGSDTPFFEQEPPPR